MVKLQRPGDGAEEDKIPQPRFPPPPSTPASLRPRGKPKACGARRVRAAGRGGAGRRRGGAWRPHPGEGGGKEAASARPAAPARSQAAAGAGLRLGRAGGSAEEGGGGRAPGL